MNNSLKRGIFCDASWKWTSHLPGNTLYRPEDPIVPKTWLATQYIQKDQMLLLHMTGSPPPINAFPSQPVLLSRTSQGISDLYWLEAGIAVLRSKQEKWIEYVMSGSNRT